MPIHIEAGTRTSKFPITTFSIVVVTFFVSVSFFKAVMLADWLSAKELMPFIDAIAQEYCSRPGVHEYESACPLSIHSPGRAEFLKRIAKQMEKPTNPEFPKLISFQQFQRSIPAIAGRVNDVYASYSLLTTKNITLKSIVLSLFVHRGWLHLLGNLFLLIIFGVFLEQRISRSKFLLIYLLGGVAGHAAGLLPQSYSQMPLYLIGTSDCICAIVGAFFILFFKRRIGLKVDFATIKFLIRVPTGLIFPLIAILSSAITVFYNLRNQGGAEAHLAGFAVGFALGLLIKKSELELVEAPPTRIKNVS